MIPFIYSIDGDKVEVMEIDAPAELEALAHGFINRGGRYIVTDHSDPLAVRIAAIVEGVNGGVHELTSEMAVRGSEQNTVARLIFEFSTAHRSGKLMADPALRPPGLINAATLGIKPAYPGAEELKLGREVDQFYGSPKEGAMREGAGISTIDIKNAPEIVNDSRFDNVKWDKIDKDQADRLYVAAIAANKSPLAGLGFDPRQFVLTKPQQEYEVGVAGAYSKKEDRIWTDENYPSTYVHESVHRGVEMLRESGAIARTPQDARISGKMTVSQYEEELITRAIMLRNFGNVERNEPGGNVPDIDRAEKMYLQNPEGFAKLEKLEALAAQQIQKNTPMGPR